MLIWNIIMFVLILCGLGEGFTGETRNNQKINIIVV